MARLQILELPEGSGDDRPPFVLVVDQYQPLRYVLGVGEEPKATDEFEGVAAQIGARGILVFQETVEIPANRTSPAPTGDAAHAGAGPNCADVPGCDGQCCKPRDADEEVRRTADAASAKLRHLGELLEEARHWARHGYEIGQKHCGWTDHGVAPDWLTEGWPDSFDSCEHLKKAAEYDTALSRVLEVAADLEAAEAHGGAWDANQQAARYIRAAIGRSRDEETRKP